MTSEPLVLPPDPLGDLCGFSETAETAVHVWLNRERRLEVMPVSDVGQLLLRHDGLCALDAAYTQEALLRLVAALVPRLDQPLTGMVASLDRRWLVPGLCNPVIGNLLSMPRVVYRDTQEKLLVWLDRPVQPQGYPAEFWHSLLDLLPESSWDGLWLQPEKAMLATKLDTLSAELRLGDQLRGAQLGVYLLLRRRLQHWQLTQLGTYLRPHGETWAVRLSCGRFGEKPTTGSLSRWLSRQQPALSGLSQSIELALSLPAAKRLPWRLPRGLVLLEQLRHMACTAGRLRTYCAQRQASLLAELSTYFLDSTGV